MASTQGALDWLDYWLNGRIDPVESKREQYARWGLMRGAPTGAAAAFTRELP